LFEQRFQIARKQTGLPEAGNNLRKSHFIVCHVTKYSTILGVFQQPWPGVSTTAILNEDKALGTRLKLHFPQFWNSYHTEARTPRVFQEIKLGWYNKAL